MHNPVVTVAFALSICFILYSSYWRYTLFFRSPVKDCFSDPTGATYSCRLNSVVKSYGKHGVFLLYDLPKDCWCEKVKHDDDGLYFISCDTKYRIDRDTLKLL
jgi:hypothetical protein